jgi:DNA polymerase-1
MSGKTARLFLIDTFGLIFRAYHARARTGAPAMRTRAGLPTEAVYIFTNMLRKLLEEQQPEYVAAVYESAEPTFRDELYTGYKANRAAPPPELSLQLPHIRKLLEALRIPILEYPRFEADDVIGALARRGVEKGLEVCVITSDKDLFQLVSDHICVINPAKDSLRYDAAQVQEFMGVAPHQVADLLALKGDAIDNIPGAPGIGEKGARDLIQRFGSVERAIEHAAEVERKMYRESLQNHRDQILLSKKLATLDTGIPIALDLEAVRWTAPDLERLRALYQELEFHSLLKELAPAPQVLTKYGSIATAEALEAWIAGAGDRPVAIAPALAQHGEMDLGGVGVAIDAGDARRAPLEAVRGVLSDPAVPKAVHDYKHSLRVLGERELAIRGVKHDTRLYSYLLEPTRTNYSLEECVLRRYHHHLAGGPAEHADFIRRLAADLAPEIDAAGLRELYETIELPLSPVLVRMEKTGIRLDPEALRGLSALMNVRLEQLTAEIYRLAAKPFNINSPQQLGKVLFEELGLKSSSRTAKTKAISTAAAVLEELAADHEIVRLVLDYRQLAKLKGTYVDALPELIRPETGRLHTTFDQCGSATGRLSSSDPNLQNIPIRTEMGREIRAAFVPQPGWMLVVADYSQIELRLLADISGDPVLVESFRRGEDIHTRTAAEVFGAPPLMVTPEDRRRAKAINFGIVYGLSAFGLAAQINVSRTEAAKYIESYFARYAGVKKFIDSTVAEVRRTGLTRTLFGRLRPIPDINAGNPAARGFAERTAVNSPLQGTAADLIKLAMIAIDRRLREEDFRAQMLLQVHDELVFEAPPEEVEALSAMVKHELESVRKLAVPLLAEVGSGPNWRDAK